MANDFVIILPYKDKIAFADVTLKALKNLLTYNFITVFIVPAFYLLATSLRRIPFIGSASCRFYQSDNTNETSSSHISNIKKEAMLSINYLFRLPPIFGRKPVNKPIKGRNEQTLNTF